MERTLRFETGRGYDGRRQRMVAAELNGGRVIFADITRQVAGETYAPSVLGFCAEGVMLDYDCGDYTPTQRADEYLRKATALLGIVDSGTQAT